MASPADKWMKTALSYLGVKEIRGTVNNLQILSWWQRIRASFRDDETPWCAAFVGGVLEECGIRSTRSAAARSYEKWGVPLRFPRVGAVVVFWRGAPESKLGHVGFLVGKDKHGNLMILGGNQGDEVSIKPFAKERVLSYRWPVTVAYPNDTGLASLPVLASNAPLSTNEA